MLGNHPAMREYTVASHPGGGEDTPSYFLLQKPEEADRTFLYSQVDS